MRTLVEQFQQRTGQLPADAPPARCEPFCRIEDGVVAPGGPAGMERIVCGKCGTWLGNRPVTTNEKARP